MQSAVLLEKHFSFFFFCIVIEIMTRVSHFHQPIDIHIQFLENLIYIRKISVINNTCAICPIFPLKSEYFTHQPARIMPCNDE